MQNPSNFHLLKFLSFPCAPSWHISLWKMFLSSSLVRKAAFQPILARLLLRPVQCCLCLCWSSLGSGWSCEWNIPQGPKFCPICSHVDLQIFPPVWDFWHPKFPGCAYIIPVRRWTWLYGLECALCNWTSSLKNTPAILPVLVWGYELCDVALWAGKEKALPRGCSWADW